MKLEWSAAALADLDRFAAFLHDRHPQLATIVAAENKSKAEILSEHPLVGRPLAGRPEFRQLVLDVLNARYIFRYATDGNRLVMLRVFHARDLREWPAYSNPDSRYDRPGGVPNLGYS